MPVDVRPVTTSADQRAFFEFPWHHYKDDPNWVPPLLSMRKDLLNKKKNPAWEYIDGQYFLAWRGSQPVGTITALINHRHNEYWDEHIGWFGTFETINDQEVADTLLNTAANWVKDKGYDAIRGPQSFTTHEETGLLVENFDRPVLMMPHNYPYYQTLVENAGFEKKMDIVSFYYDREMVVEHGFGERLRKIADRAMKRSNITVRHLDTSRKKEEFRIFRDLYNSAWDKNWGFVPMNDKELDALVDSLGMFVEQELALFAEVDGEPAGFALAVPDFNELLHKVYPRPGVPELWSLAQIAWHWKVRRIIRGTRIPLLGVKREFQDRGVELTLMLHLLESIKPTQYTHIDCGWILETNELVPMSVKLGADMYRTHRYYEKALK